MRDKEAEARAVLETAPDGILTVDTDGEIISSNRAAARIFGRDRDEVIGKRIQNLVISLDADTLTRANAATDFGASQVHTGVTTSEDTFPAEIAFGTLDAGHRDGVVLVLRDITERVEAEQELERARDEAIEASRAKSSFLANMSHELRTPLNAVIGYSEMIMEEIQFVQEADEPGAEIVAEFVPDLTRIRTAGKHLLSIINDILDLSKIEAGKMTTHVELFDVRELLDDIVGTIRPLADKNGNDLQLTLGDEVRFMRSDMTKVRQILFNLLSNACKFTENGQVELRAELDLQTERLVFQIVDDGIGMTEEQLETIFEAFTQADSSTTREFGGTGLGLTITSHFCALLGGDVDVESAPGEGTTFMVRLAADLEGEADEIDSPSNEIGALEERSSALEQVSSSEGDIVLVIDDDPTMRDLLRRLLDREGFHVVTAASGSEGFLLAEQLQPSAITLDVMMPSMDGWTLLSKLKERPELADIPVVMVTMVSESARGYALGADHYLVKPVDRDQLVGILDSYRRAGEAAAGEVLLVEDDEPTRSLIRRTLEKDGWKVTEADNGQVGLDKLDQMQPDLVLLDLMMPKMDGFEFLRHFRQDDAYVDVPVVVVTAKVLTAEDEERLRAGVSEILAKDGSEQDRLLEEVREQVKRVTSRN
ncbi:MAG: response regulator [Persicimonas sp.]